MNSKQIVVEVMNVRGMTQKTLAEKLGYATATGVANRLNGKTTKDMSVATLVEFLAAMDCELVVRSKLQDKGKWTVTRDVENKEN